MGTQHIQLTVKDYDEARPEGKEYVQDTIIVSSYDLYEASCGGMATGNMLERMYERMVRSVNRKVQEIENDSRGMPMRKTAEYLLPDTGPIKGLVVAEAKGDVLFIPDDPRRTVGWVTEDEVQYLD